MSAYLLGLRYFHRRLKLACLIIRLQLILHQHDHESLNFRGLQESNALCVVIILIRDTFEAEGQLTP